MKRNFLSKLLVLLLLVASAAGCKTRKIADAGGARTGTPVPEKAALDKAQVIKTLSAGQPVFNTLAIRAKADMNINNDSHDVSMNIRIRKDEVIWVSVTAFAGIEAARALITPDSVKILNRLQGEYTARPFSFIHRFTNQQVDFKTVQALFTATAFPGTLSQQSDFSITNNQTAVSGNFSSLFYRLLFDENVRLVQNQLEDKSSGQTLTVNYSDFQEVNGQRLPYGVNISSVANNKNIGLRLRCNSVELNTNIDIPFTVPKRFNVK